MKNHYYLGVDASKGYADFIILNANKKVIEDNFQLDDTFDGHNQLHKIISGFCSKHPNAKIFAGVESTGGYENNWLNFLSKCQSEFNLSVSRVNPFGVNYNSKASLKRIITDKESARNIAEYLISHSEKVTYNNEDYYSSAKRLWTYINMLSKQKVQLLNQLETLLYTANPEIIQYCGNGIRLWTIKMLQGYPTAKELSKVSVTTLSKIPYISAKKARELIDNAKNSIASKTDSTTAQIIKSLTEQILQLQESIKFQNSLLEKSCNLPEVELLKSFDGIGTYSAVGLMIEIVSIERFATVKKLASFFGLHPVYKQSGDGLSGFKMSKKGRKQPREILFNVAQYAANNNPHIKEIYRMHLRKGMTRMAALGAIMYKILRIVYGMLKNNTKYNPAIDKANREKQLGKTHNTKADQKRRFQKIDSSAPISKRQNKKRKEQEKSQIFKPLEAESNRIFAGSDSHSSPNSAEKN